MQNTVHTAEMLGFFLVFFQTRSCEQRSHSDLWQQPRRLVARRKGDSCTAKPLTCSVDHRVSPLERLNATIKDTLKQAFRQAKWVGFFPRFVLKIPLKLPIIRRTVIFNGLSMASAIVRLKPQMKIHLYRVQHQVYLFLSCSTMYYISIIL